MLISLSGDQPSMMECRSNVGTPGKDGSGQPFGSLSILNARELRASLGWVLAFIFLPEGSQVIRSRN